MSRHDYPTRFSSVMAKVYAAALLLVLIAVGARLVWWLIEPLLGIVAAIVVIGGIYMFIFRGLRR